MSVAEAPGQQHLEGGALEKGLKAGAIGFVSSVVIGVASTTPGYSLAASLGIVAAAVAFQSPAALLVAFVPMFLIAGSYYSMNRVDPDCGTTFTWVTKGIGPARAGSPAGRCCSPIFSSWRASLRSRASTRSCSSAPTASPPAPSG